VEVYAPVRLARDGKHFLYRSITESAVNPKCSASHPEGTNREISGA
jgi:hypothetical protein